MDQSEHDGLRENAEPKASCERAELALKIATKN